MHLLARLKPRSERNDDWLERRLRNENIYAPALSRHFQEGAEQGLLLGFSGTNEIGLRYGVERLASLLTDVMD